MNLIGKMIDNRYELLEKIGNGGMAIVYKAKCHVLNRFVAVKILKDEFTTDTEFIKKFNSEAQSAASLTHPNIVSIYDVGNEDNLYYIVMELIQGKTLKEIIQEDGVLSWKWSINIAIQIASALEVAHKNNIVHRDIKPHNIIITEDGIAKVTDFGIAKAVSNSTMTAFGTTIGSVHYFSPEHAKGGYTDAKSDLYSLGVVLYEMLTGRVPFDADTSVSVALKQIQEEPVEPIKYNDQIPESVNRIILKAMQKDPNYRYQSATEMLVDLNRVLKSPEDDFVVLKKYHPDSPTQRIPLIHNSDVENAGDKVEEKKKNKFLQFFEEHKVLRVFAILLLVVILFFGAFFGTLALFSRPSQIQIPNLVQSANGSPLKEEEAVALLKSAGITNYKIDYKYSDKVEKGYVISQEPAYQDNYSINLNEEFRLIVSKGTEEQESVEKLKEIEEKLKQTTVTLPKKMIGKKKDDVIKELEKLTEDYDDNIKVKYEIVEEYNEEVEAGVVIRVNYNEGEDITLDKTVILTVSKGSQYRDVTVPSVVNKTEAEAVSTLQGLGLVVDTQYEENTNKSDGVVISQSISANKTVKEGTTISISVNKLPKKSTVNITVNLKSLMKYEETEPIVVGNEVKPSEVKKAKVVIKVGDDIVYSETKELTTTNITASYSATGVKDVKVYVDDVVRGNKSVDFSKGDQSIIFE